MLAQLRRGVIWTYLSIAIGGVIQLGVTGVTARLLDPTAFGLVAMANVILRLGSYVAQMGLGRALIQRPEIDDDDVRAAFTSSMLLGLVVASVVVLAAPLAADFFKSQAVVPIVRWLALTFVARGLGSTAQALLRRNLRFRGGGLVEVAAFALGYGLPTVWLAATGFGVWSLVVGAVGQAAVATGLAYALTRHALTPTFRFDVHRRLLGFGTKVSVISFFEFLGSTLDSAVIGRFGSAAQLGLYNRAFMLATLPTYQVHNGIAKVLFPVLSGGQGDRAEFRASLQRITGIAIRLMLPLGVGMALASPELVSVVLGPQWSEATPLFAVLALAAVVNLLATFPGVALEAIGVLRSKAILQAAYVAALAAALLLVVFVGGLQLRGVVLVIAAAYTLRTLALFALGAIAGVYEPQVLRNHLGLALVSVALSGGLVGGGLAVTRAMGFSSVGNVVTAMVGGALSLVVLFATDLLGLARRGGWLPSRKESGSTS